MTRKYTFLITLLLISTLFSQLFSQDDELQSNPVHKRERAISFSLATSGFGLGGVYRWPLPSYMHVGLDLEFFGQFIFPFSRNKLLSYLNHVFRPVLNL